MKLSNGPSLEKHQFHKHKTCFEEYFSKHSKVSSPNKVNNQEITGLFSSACIADNL